MKIVAVIFMSIVALMLFLIIKYPKIQVFKKEVQTFWIAPLLGTIFVLLFHFIDLDKVISGLTTNSSINPIKIIILFFSMTFMSIVLDELGFFEYLAHKALNKAKANQKVLFFILYALTSILTIFTSNDIIILTFTPFIIFFTKNAKINPLPYLVSEFAAANTWSMMFIIGNPTNIYLATSNNLNFLEYFRVMFLPSVMSGLVLLLVLYLLFKNELSKPLQVKDEETPIKNKFLLVSNLICLGLCTLILVISSYIGLDMYLIALIFATILLAILIGYSIVNKNASYLTSGIKRIPWSLAPFVISMFTLVLMLEEYSITEELVKLLGDKNYILKYGVSSTLTCNIVNNLPMSVLFAKIIPNGNLQAIYSTIIGSNIGAFLSPIGALAGIMWLSILKKYNVNYNFMKFMKYGVMVVIPTLFTALLGLAIIL